MINVGDNNISGVYLGDEELSVYIGDELIYPLNFGELTAITITNLTWVTDIPYSGGTGTSSNCSYLITGYYDSGKTRKLNRFSVVDGEITASSTTSETRELIGTLVLTATCSGFSATGSVDAYQEKYETKIWVNITGVTNTIPFDGIGWTNDYMPYRLDNWIAESSGLTTQSMRWTGGRNAENGWYSQHRWNQQNYAQDYVDRSKYADDVLRSTLPLETIQVDGVDVSVRYLDLSSMQGFVPTYTAYDNPALYSGTTGAVYVRINR